MNAAAPPDPEHLRMVNALLEVALALPDSERSAWLDTLPPEQRSFAPLLDALLARASVETDRFMQRPVALGFDDLEPDHDQAGDQIGPYRLISELGVGGMATVWLAERSDGVLQRQVALKLPREGRASGLARRMARERAILGALEHPRIARLYDAGVTPAGRPWMALEYVAGLPIDEHCRQHALDVPQRLQLFLQIADALMHAHARLVVHRDLKPSNILVGHDGEIRLLDFGVAKLLESEPDGAGNLTQTIGRAVTPDYASPEQLAGKPVSVATDVYSLGVVLYELLAGQRPHRVARRIAAPQEPGPEEDAPPASSVAGRALAPRLRGDIDAMLAKALRKDPAHRYGSVEAFAADVKRHLAGEPVLAQVPSRRYRLAKALRRHRFGLMTGAAMSASIVIGMGAALWQAREARLEAARADQVKGFIASIFKQAAPREGVGGGVTASDLLTAASQRIEKELAGNPRAAAELGVIVGGGFFSLGEAYKGEAALRAAIARAEQTFGPRHAVTLQGKALLIESLGYKDLSLTEQLLAQVVPDALAGLPETAEGAVFALRSQSWVRRLQGRSAASYAAARQAIDIAERHLGRQHRDTIRTIGLLSSIHGSFGSHAEQLSLATTALARAQAAYGARPPHPILTVSQRWFGEALLDNQRPAEAVPVLSQVLRDQRLLDAAADTPRVLLVLRLLGVAQADVGRVDLALPLLREAVALEGRLNAGDGPDRWACANALADALATARLGPEALALHVRLSRLPSAGDDRPQAIIMEGRRARLLALRGEADAAAAASSATAASAGDRYGQIRAGATISAAFNARVQGRPADALGFAQQALDDPQASTFRLDLQANAAAELGLARLELGDIAGAEGALARSRDLYRRAQVEPSVRNADLLIGEARLHLRAGRPAQAEALMLPLVAAWQLVDAGSEWHGEALHWLARAERALGKVDLARIHDAAASSMLKRSRLPALRRLAAA